MAQRVNVVLVDDLDGTEGAETVKFGLDGQSYEIDLNNKNAQHLRKALDKYVNAGRKEAKRRQRRNTPKLSAVG